MGYDIFKFGVLFQGNQPQHIPIMPNVGGDIPAYDAESAISIRPAISRSTITWIKPHGANLFVADRVLLVGVTWNELKENGFVLGKEIVIDGQRFRCRLLQVGLEVDVPNEWDQVLAMTGDADTLWNWSNIFFWGADALDNVGLYPNRGWAKARHRTFNGPDFRSLGTGFRPALDPIGLSATATHCWLEGTEFRMGRIPDGEVYCPTLQPVQSSAFAGIPDGYQVHMYTLLKNGRPVHTDLAIPGTFLGEKQLEITDRYFGDEYLIPWTISGGIAVAQHALLGQHKMRRPTTRKE